MNHPRRLNSKSDRLKLACAYRFVRHTARDGITMAVLACTMSYVNKTFGAAARVRRAGSDWVYSASAPVRAGMVFSLPTGTRSGKGWTIPGATRAQLCVATLPAGRKVMLATTLLPAGKNVSLRLQKTPMTR
jgi:hypothetical protein